ncbi:DNA sulfur modification protein DndB [Euzebya pacifica]|nr:DNA sulfur modification protein DndB [Euzebya pacifica]
MLTIDVSEGSQGIHRYFTGTVSIAELDGRVVFPEDLAERLEADEEMQRAHSASRTRKMSSYLLDAADHFYSAVTLIIMPLDLDDDLVEGDPENLGEDWGWAFERAPKWGISPGRSRLGRLHLTGSVRLFPGDGQHRLLSCFAAMQTDPNIGVEQIPVVLLPFTGFEQVRQLFADLNLNARPVSKTIGYDFDSRDPEALLAKAVADSVDLFKGRVNKRNGRLPGDSVITLNTIVKGDFEIVTALGKIDEGLHEQVAPPSRAAVASARNRLFDGDLDVLTERVCRVWDVVVRCFRDEWDCVLRNEPTSSKLSPAALLRQDYLFPHGLAMQGLAMAAGEVMCLWGDDWQLRFEKAVASFDWRRESPDWFGTAVVTGPNGPRINNTGAAVKDLARTVAARA